jgi:hypothetical protein
MESKQEAIDGVNINIASNDEELETLKQSVGYCPFCGTVFSK